MKKKYVCIHGHFYQPPRENPWLNEVEVQDSAYPFHDWNHRITAECYARNSASRILDEEGRIIEIVNNYSRISFNFGPTLLEWMEKHTPEVYASILAADKESRERFSGHGSALAQAYNHMIMPLANERDKHTQVIWGIKDFEYRFGRKPVGMWCGETAMDTPTMEVLAEHGIKFTILSPYQAKKVRKIGEKEWHNAADGKVDPRNSYVVNLPSGKKLSVFFYDGPVSRGIAFEKLLNDGNEFAKRLTGLFDDREDPQLINIATDGETYGHHHRFGEMALSYCLHQIETKEDAELTIYSEYLEKNPPEYEAKIKEPSSWSCPFGVERWRSDCGVNTGMNPGWHQKWRGPLRTAFDWLRDELEPLFERELGKFVDDPWEVRNEYIAVILDRSRENVENFLRKHAGEKLTHSNKAKILKLLEMEYHAMLMYTSCGWFFDEVTGIETIQDMAYAARAAQLAEELSGKEFVSRLKALLEKAPSNIPEYGNAAIAFEKHIEPAILDLRRVGAHYAVSSIFAEYPKELKLYSFNATSDEYYRYEAGKYKLVVGRTLLESEITLEQDDVSFAVLHLGDHQLFGGVREYLDEEAFSEMHEEVKDAFFKSNVHEIMLLMDKHFGTHNYSFWHLFKDDQKRILEKVLETGMTHVEGIYRQVYDNHYPVMQALNKLNMKLPQQLKTTADFVVNSKLRRLLEAENANVDRLRNVKEEIRRLSVQLDLVTLNYIATNQLERAMVKLQTTPLDIEAMKHAADLIKVIHEVPLSPDLWKPQNICFIIRTEYYDKCHEDANNGNEERRDWCKLFDELYANLGMTAIRLAPESVG